MNAEHSETAEVAGPQQGKVTPEDNSISAVASSDEGNAEKKPSENKELGDGEPSPADVANNPTDPTNPTVGSLAQSERPAGEALMTDLPAGKQQDGKNDPTKNPANNRSENNADSQGNNRMANQGNRRMTNPNASQTNGSSRITVDSKNNGRMAEQDDHRDAESNKNSRMADRNRNRNPATPTPTKTVKLAPQKSRQGQNTMTNRRKLKITEKLVAVSESEDRPGEDQSVRENVVEIERMLAEAESGLRLLVDGLVADSDRAEQFRRLDLRLGNVEKYVADLREQTRDNQFAFVGLQMVDITRTHVTPARDRIFSAIQRPVASEAESTAALQHIVRARESLAALLKRYDRVERERKLKKSMEEAVKMYEVYVEKRRILMREARQNKNPLDRKMAVIEVDQDYLDRLAEVQTLRREMIEGFAQMLGDDPRLLSRYLELIKRRGRSLRDQLSEISERQYEATEEGLSWLQIDQTQKSELWSIIVEIRLNSINDLAQDAAQLAERIEKQLPLNLKNDVGTPAAIIRQAKMVASRARTVNFDAERIASNGGKVADETLLVTHARGLLNECNALFALLDRLQFENEDDEGVADYLDRRLLETRAVADQADSWTLLSESLARESYAGLVNAEQHRLAVTTQTLRIEMLDMESDLVGQFRQLVDSDLPGEIKDMIRNLHRLMETITFNQAAAAFRASQGNMESAVAQQELALERLEEAEKLFDRIRRAVVQKLDEYDPPDPNITDLEDPTLDEFLARLEREPNITTQLGIPNRRTNLRVVADSVTWQQAGSNGGLGDSNNAAAARLKEAMKMRRQRKKGSEDEKQASARSKEQEEMQKQAKRAQEMLEQSLMKIKAQRDAEETSDEQRKRLQQLANDLEEMLEQSKNEDGQSQDAGGDQRVWQQIVESDQAIAMVEAIARGEALPDEQWNRLLSELDDGLWQVRGKLPPEAYRKAIHEYQDQIRELMQTIGEP